METTLSESISSLSRVPIYFPSRRTLTRSAILVTSLRLMADIDDGDPLVSQGQDDLEELFRLPVAQGGGGLVHDKHFAFMDQGPGYLYLLLFGDGEMSPPSWPDHRLRQAVSRTVFERFIISSRRTRW